jgi:hypothetical protein
LDAVAALRRYPVLKNRTLEARSRAVIGNRSSTDFCGEAQGDELAHRRTVGVGLDRRGMASRKKPAWLGGDRSPLHHRRTEAGT